MGRPRILLLDEPAGGLDAGEIQELGELITKLDCAVLLVEHHLDLVMSVCDEVLVLDFGKPVAFGMPAEIRANPAVTEAYLGDPARILRHPGRSARKWDPDHVVTKRLRPAAGREKVGGGEQPLFKQT